MTSTSSTPVVLRYLTLSAIPRDRLPTSTSTSNAEAEDEWTSELKREAVLLLNHHEWSAPKQWHHNTVTTYSLPQHAVTHEPHFTEKQPLTTTGNKKSSGGSWFGKNKPTSTSHHGDDDQVQIGWWKRTSKLTNEQCGGIGAMWQTLGLQHTEQEQEYVASLSKVHQVQPGLYMKLYSLPFPTTNRSFLTYITVIPTSSTSFLVIAQPVKDDSPDTNALDKHYVRGRFVSAEQVRQLDDGSIEWSCVSQSYAAGSIPTSLSESHMASSMAAAVPAFISYLKKRLPDLPKDSGPPAPVDNGAAARADGKEQQSSLRGLAEATPPASKANHEPETTPATPEAKHEAAHDHKRSRSHERHPSMLEDLRKRLSFQLRGDLAQTA